MGEAPGDDVQLRDEDHVLHALHVSVADTAEIRFQDDLEKVIWKRLGLVARDGEGGQVEEDLLWHGSSIELLGRSFATSLLLGGCCLG